MRAILAIVIAAAALVQALVDWQATIGRGYAYRLSSIGSTIADYWPDGHQRLVDSLQRSGVPFAWEPVGALVMSIPLALLLAVVAALLWVTRPREVRRR